ncbi:hypothetical protein [Nocardioides sp. YIM 152315]|uniref:hypothetical protein n=1 Tax=Nocardioides sp. YIM 152315 TaxID=3031760 RepID=UPI0023DB5371|nr:hypothetical protein [Nocardioides sp. YIM 152315]MDF1602875.1 hypothetical protein [Nocardioides sp. YIM 152315]
MQQRGALVVVARDARRGDVDDQTGGPGEGEDAEGSAISVDPGEHLGVALEGPTDVGLGDSVGSTAVSGGDPCRSVVVVLRRPRGARDRDSQHRVSREVDRLAAAVEHGPVDVLDVPSGCARAAEAQHDAVEVPCLQDADVDEHQI